MKNKVKNNETAKLPQALIDFGEDVFIKTPLYKAKEKYRALYINRNVFKTCFGFENLSFEQMAEIIENKFSTTIDKSKAIGKQIGEAFVDMQEDPLDIALSGNLGSGRAFYQDGIFNIKGEKTPLAISTKPEYSNGVLELEKAIYETVASNSLYNDVNIKLAPILAILDINEECNVSWKSQICRRAKIVRVDINGALNRVTHAFKAKKKLNKKELETFSINVGEVEGEKFIERIIHGAWSAGNISPLGHMIDFDTVCAVKYRAPQYSYSKWHIDNYFGFEYLGQLKILKSLMDKPDKKICNLLIKSREEYIIKNFSKFMGIKSIPITRELKTLVRLFMKLSIKTYPIFEDLSTKVSESFSCAPFDFSSFFRVYPILKNKNLFDKMDALNIMIPTLRDFPNFNIKDFDKSTYENGYFYKNVLKTMDKCLLHSLDELLLLSKECLTFIDKYDHLYSKHSKDKNKEEKNAYIFNEDRENLTMIKSIAGPIDDCKKEMTFKEIDQTIEATILSNKRSGNISNVQVYKKGIFFIEHNDLGEHRLCLKLYGTSVLEKCFIEINGIRHNVYVTNEDNDLIIRSPYLDNINLLRYKNIAFFNNQKKISMKRFVFSFTKRTNVSNFSF